MVENANKTALLAALKAEAQRLGLKLQGESGEGFKGEIESVLIKWMLGKKTMVYKMSLGLDESSRAVRFREAVKESSFGILPPTLTLETTSLKGKALSGTHRETSPAGKGTVDFGKVREALKQAVENAGWRFDLEAGRMP